MTNPLVTALRDLETDHRILDGIFAAVRTMALPCAPSQHCRIDECDEGSRCAQNMREHFHRSMFAVVGHFGREVKITRQLLSNEAFQRHIEQHGDISSALQQAIIDFSQSQDVKAAQAFICAIADQIDTHQRTQDIAFMSLVACSPQETNPVSQPSVAPAFITGHLPALPLTGNAQIDEEHARLHDILHRTLSLCHVSYPECTQCTSDTQHHCTDSAIDLITDALKFMVEHFRHEETLLKQHPQVAGVQAHLDNHAELSRRMSQLIGDYDDNNTALCLFRLVETLHVWLHKHILEHDQLFIDQMAAQASPLTTT
ncbi:MAG: hemerythrin family protein [Rhodocyclaceae bacterium]|nr:hemerythrin family protein [Rhodocyclaceae bacterium]MDZ4214191.1 hemerythrin family protein [Rhodocyclaceae bacterium]